MEYLKLTNNSRKMTVKIIYAKLSANILLLYETAVQKMYSYYHENI